MIFAVACSAGYLWSTYVVPETANVSLEEIDALFKSPAARNDLALKIQVNHLSKFYLIQENSYTIPDRE